MPSICFACWSSKRDSQSSQNMTGTLRTRQQHFACMQQAVACVAIASIGYSD